MVGVALGANAALGAPQEMAVLYSYEAPGDCPSATAFWDQFAERTPRVRITSSATAAHLSFIVRLSHENGQVVGKLTMRGRGGLTSHRVVSAQSCDEVVPVLAFVAALAADPSAQPAPSAPASPSAPTSPPGGSPARQVPPTSGVATPSVIAPHRPSAPTQPPKLPRHEVAHDTLWRFSLTGQVGAISGPAPKWRTLGALFFQVDVPRLVWGTRGRFSFGFMGALPSVQETYPGSVKFQWLTAATVICPVVIGLSDGWSTAPCITGELGMLRGAASGISIPEARTRWWRAVGAAIQLRWMAKARYFLHSDAAVTSPLARDEFGIVEEGRFVSVHKVPWIVGRVGIGAGIFF